MAPSHYATLALSPSLLAAADDPAPLVRRAYMRALLRHHPDKARTPSLADGSPPVGPGPASCLPFSSFPASSASTTTTTTTTAKNPPSTDAAATGISIDAIREAYRVLANPRSRAEYDRQLILSSASATTPTPTSTAAAHEDFQTGMESLDLDDLICDADDEDDDDSGKETSWWRACRCGNPRGFLVTEADLMAASDLGELLVGCLDCSLWIKVHFAAVDDG
jgi:hypothetical protein